ncbi:MAG: glycosyltransferase family 4 protein [Chloroflexi bacterium]|nr:glycosyltransferase family 4 protein [Chloroflexota bacterium]
MLFPLLIFIALTILAYLGVAWIRRVAIQRAILDHPNERSSHSIPTPRGGGLAIVVLTILIIIAWNFAYAFTHKSVAFCISGVLLAYVGWRDDVRSLSPRVRFMIQFVAIAIAMLGMGWFRAVTIPVFGVWNLGWVGIPITFIWILGLINAYNFMDGIDGIAGGVAFVAALGWIVLTSSFGGSGFVGRENPFTFWLALSVAATSLGFLGHNWPPARIFMGDVGSTFLGFTFAVLPLTAGHRGGDALMFGTAIMWTFIMDAGLTFLRRLARRENVFAAHRTHLYQRLVVGGVKVATVSALFALLTLLGAGLSLAWGRGFHSVGSLILFGLPVIWIILSIYTARRSSTPKG